MGIFDEIFSLPEKVIEKAVSLPSDLAKGVADGVKKTIENVEDIVD